MDENDNKPLGLVCEVMEHVDEPGSWLVEVVNEGSEGEIYRADFSGPGAQERAFAYATETYGWHGTPMTVSYMHQPTPRPPKPALRLV